MTHYCLCEDTGNKMLTKGAETKGVLLAGRRMAVQLVGVRQYVGDGSSAELRPHYPNVDILYCEKCGATVALEAG